MTQNRPVALSLLGFAVALAAVGLALSLSAEDERRVEVLPQPVSQMAQPSPERHTVMVEVVRIGERGDTVIAGRADSMADIQVELTGTAIGSVLADSRGEWVFVPTAPIPEGLQVLTLADKAGGPPSRVLTVISRHHGQPARTILVPPNDRLRVLSGSSRQDFAALALERTPTGSVTIAGRAEPGKGVQAWFGKGLAGRTQADPDGDWRLDLANSAEPLVRVESVDAKGKSQVRLDLPMPPPGQNGAPQSITVQGSLGWRVAFPDGRIVDVVDASAGR
ncbi:exported hypothetical protein [Magnetospirillum sp. LM-5]|uniref:hypothetical protein n=1 Tax=Magnetospirillum sp. LM-5 TaxID=2681466 RepID=UPI00137C4C80|nr:hypothetical protein [Magnetospirillum sp. LM-5]CAA7623805.1 exported hypothetical protein [Magnetospirillum sp. LM-5]